MNRFSDVKSLSCGPIDVLGARRVGSSQVMPRFLILVALVAATTLSVVPVSAQSEPSDETRAAARAAYARGQELHRAGQYAESEAAFLEAYELIPNPVVLLGVAEARERAENAVGTVEVLERYLNERTDAPDRADVEARIARLRELPATLVIASEPSGAQVSLNGSATGQTTPTEIEVPAGTHTLAFSVDGHDDAERTVEAPFGTRTEVSVTMAETAEPEQIEPVGDPIEETPESEGSEEDDDAEGPSAGVWVTTGLAAASLIGGTVLGFMALSREADFDDAPDEDTADEGERFALFADVLFGVAAVSAITAVVLFLTDKAAEDDEEEEEESASLQVAPVFSPSSAGVNAEVRF